MLPPACLRRRYLVAAALAVSALYLVGITAYWWPTSDSALYLGLGRSLAEGQGYRFNGQVHSLVTPGFPAILAGLRLAFGPSYVAPYLFVCLCGLAALAFIWLAIERLSDRRTAFVVTLCTALSYSHFHLSHLILTDVPYVLTFWMSVYCVLRFQRGSLWWLVPACAATVAGILIRVPGLLLVAALAVGVLFDRSSALPLRRRLAGSAALAATVALTAAIMFFVVRPMVLGRESYAVHYANFMTARAAAKGPLFFLKDILTALWRLPGAVAELLTGQDALWPLGLVVCLLVVIGSLRWWTAGRRLPVVLWLLFFLELAVITRAIYDKRYLLPIQPLLLLATLEGLSWTASWHARRRNSASAARLPRLAVAVFVGIVLVVNAPRVARDAFYYSYLSHTSRYYEVVRDGKFRRLFAIAEVLKGVPASGAAFVGSDDVTIVHWLSRRQTLRLPRTPRQSAGDARKVYEYVMAQPQAMCVALDTASGSPSYRRGLFWLFATRPLEFEFLGDARGDLVFRRLAAP